MSIVEKLPRSRTFKKRAITAAVIARALLFPTFITMVCYNLCPPALVHVTRCDDDMLYDSISEV